MRIYKRLRNSINLEELAKGLGNQKVFEYTCENTETIELKTLVVPIEGNVTKHLYLNEESISDILGIPMHKASAILEDLYVQPVTLLTGDAISSKLQESKRAEEEIAVSEDRLAEEAYSNVSVDATCNKLFYYCSNVVNATAIANHFGQEAIPLLEINKVRKKDLSKFRESNRNIKEFKILIEDQDNYIVLDSDLIHEVTKIDKFRIVLTMHSVTQKLRQGNKFTDLFEILTEELKTKNV